MLDKERIFMVQEFLLEGVQSIEGVGEVEIDVRDSALAVKAGPALFQKPLKVGTEVGQSGEKFFGSEFVLKMRD